MAERIDVSTFWKPPPEPRTKLGRHRQLAPAAGIHVSPIYLGAMNLGDAWASILGAMDRAECFALLDAFCAAGGNFVDTSSNYQDGQSEQILGKWMKVSGVRDQMVIATKYTNNFKRGEEIPQKTAYVGNNFKSLYLAVEASLEKLQTKYIDILYLHMWDWTFTIQEVMNGLHNLVVQGKVLYLVSVSDTPAWIVSEANMYAKLSGKTPFVVYQGAWNVMKRDLEREIIPMAREHDMAIAPWNVLAGGRIRTDAEEGRRRRTGEKGRITAGRWERTPEQKKVCQAFEKVAAEVGAKSITAVAIAYMMQKTPYVFPIVGGRKVEHLMDNIHTLEIALSPQIAYIESVLPFDAGFPPNIIGDGTTYTPIMASAGHFDRWPRQESTRPRQ